MKYRNNLNDFSENSYFEVTDSFEVYVPVGTYESNVSVGSSKMLGVLYKRVTLSPGDYVYDLHGGVFVTCGAKDRFHQARMQLSDKHPLERSYDEGLEVYPLDKLKAISKPNINFNYDISLPAVDAPASFYGRSIDAILEM